MSDQEKTIKVMVTLWDGDIYILTGYKSAEEAEYKLSLVEKARMPNGDVIKTSAVAKVQSYESYKFQKDQHSRHKRGQWISNGEWNDIGGVVGNANLKSITGQMKALEAPGRSTAPQLE